MASKPNQKKPAKKGMCNLYLTKLSVASTIRPDNVLFKGPTSSTASRAANNDARVQSESQSSRCQNEDSLVGYIQDVSPSKLSAKGATYFSFSIQNKDKVSKAICFSPEKWKLVESKAESCTPCKLSKYRKSNKDGDENVVWVNQNTRIDDAPDTIVNFPYTKIRADAAPSTSVEDLKDVKVNQLVTLQGQVVFASNTVEEVGTKKEYKKREGYFVDHTGSIAFTVWNESIQLVQDGAYYEAQNLRLRQYNSEKYVSSTLTSVFKKLANTQQAIPQSIIEDARKKASSQAKEVVCDDIQSVDIIHYYSCVACSKRVQSLPDSVMIKCDYCRVRFLLKKSKRTTTARICIRASDNQPQWFSLFPTALEEIIAKYGGDNACLPLETLDQIDDEKLSEIILVAQGMKLIVNNSSNNVNNVKFV